MKKRLHAEKGKNQAQQQQSGLLKKLGFSDCHDNFLFKDSQWSYLSFTCAIDYC